MAPWLARFKSINRAVEQAHGWIALFAAIGAVFAFLAGAMTWVASSITALAQHGWGVPVFAGIGASLVVILGLSHAAVPAARAWRHMFPLAPDPGTSPLPIFATKETAAAPKSNGTYGDLDLRERVDALDRKLEATRLEIPELNRIRLTS